MVYASGLGTYPPPPIATAAPASPLIGEIGGSFALFDALADTYALWTGLTPGLVGVGQVNVRVPESTREGCAVPLRLIRLSMSQPVTISIRRGGGPCVDPPAASTGVVAWEETITSKSQTDTTI